MLAIVRATRKAKDAFAKKIQAGFEEDRIEIVAKPLQKRGQNQIIVARPLQKRSQIK